MKHNTVNGFHTKPVQIHLIGCGGTGSQVLTGLARLQVAMLGLGHPYGLQVTAWDPDRVSQSNIGRQLFTVPEIGQYKSECLIHRINMHFGFDWEAKPEKFFPTEYIPDYSVAIVCVDSRASRAEINTQLPRRQGAYVLDCGNDNSFGQVLLGNGSKKLPYPYKAIPELIDTSIKEDNRPSCSLAEALEHQALFVNQWIATAALELIWRLFRKGGLDYRGFYINLDNGRMNPIAIE